MLNRDIRYVVSINAHIRGDGLECMSIGKVGTGQSKALKFWNQLSLLA